MANRVTVEFGASTTELKNAVDDVNTSLDSVKGHTQSLADDLKALAALGGIVLTFDGLKQGFDSLTAFAGQVQSAQSQMGGSLQSMTTLSGVAAMTGVSFQSLQQAVAEANLNIQKSTKDGFTPASQALKVLGLSARELQGLSTEQWFAKVSDAVSRFNPSLNLTTTVQTAFGRGITQLMPLLLEGSDGFSKITSEVEHAQRGLAAALPGISETKSKLDLLTLSSKAFGAQIFTMLKPAIDSAIDMFQRLTSYITPQKIGDAANAIGNVLINIAQNVAEFLARCEASVIHFKDMLLSLVDIKITMPDMSAISDKLNWMTDKVEGAYASIKSTLAEHLPQITIGNDATQEELRHTAENLLRIQAAADRARAALNNAVPTTGSWQAMARDMDRLNTEVLATAENFTRLDAPVPNFGIKNALAAQSERIEAEIAAEQQKLERIKIILNEEAAANKLTETQKTLATETAIAQSYQAEMNFIAQKIALYARGSKEYEAAEKEKAKLTADYEKQMLQTVVASQKEMTTTITQNLQTVTSAFNSQLRGLLAGTTSWASAMKSIAADLFLKMIEAVEQWAVKHAATILADSLLQKTQAATDVATAASAEAAKTAATVSGAASRAAAETTGSAAGLSGQISNAITSIGIDAGKVFAGVFGFLAPIMGPAAAGPAAASEATALAAGMAPLAVGAWDIPSIMPALLHPGEMVVPENFASGLRSQIGGGNSVSSAGASTGGGISLNFSNFIGNQQFINQIMPQLSRALASYSKLNPSVA